MSEATWNLGAYVGEVSKHAEGPDIINDTCYNCGQPGHRKNECPEPPKNTGECFNCGEIGHVKSDCDRPRVFSGTCRNCGTEGHRAMDCPSKAISVYDDSVPDIDLSESWQRMVAADKEKDVTLFRDAMNAYTKKMTDMTFQQMERELRQAGMNIHLVAKETEIPDVMTAVNLQGEKDQKYVVSFQLSYKPSRPKFAAGWPSSPDENMDRLAQAGYVRDAMVTKCRRCGEIGHTSKGCSQDAPEKQGIKCHNCNEEGHYLRDCPQPRVDRNACRNCGEAGHRANECTQERSAANVECRGCGQVGHFSRDCPDRKPILCRNCGEEGHKSAECTKERQLMCRNCDEVGHSSRECPKPRDYSRVQCRRCNEYGHTQVRCPLPEESGGASDAVAAEDAGSVAAGGLDAGSTAGEATVGAFDTGEGAW